jgi:hypothetical protein
MSAVAAYSSPRPLATPRAGNLPAAVLVALAAILAGGCAVLVGVAVVVLALGHDGAAVEREPLLAGAGFACAYTACVVALWRRGRLHPAALTAIWGCGLLVAAPGAAIPGAAVAVAGGALALCLGSKAPVWRSRRLLVVLWLGACALSVAAGVLAPPAHVRPALAGAGRPAPATAAPATAASAAPATVSPANATPSPSAATATPSAPARAATPAPSTATQAAATASPSHAATTTSSTPAQAAATASPAHAATTTPPEATATPAPTPASPAPTAPSHADAGPPPVTVAPPNPQAVAAATGLVRTFYAALDAHRFAAAWATLPPALHTSFGGFSHWRAGYRATLSSQPGQIRVTATAAGGLLVRHVLVATDRTRCGTRTQRFAVRWQLAPGRASWGVVSLAATALGPAKTACL